jgi:large subunit ribosomal protein L21
VQRRWQVKIGANGSMYAIIRCAGRQYRAEVGMELDVDKLPHDVDQKIEIDDVLMVGDGETTVIGQPRVESARVKATVIKQFRGEKIMIFHYRQRTNLRKWTGHRSYYTRLRIDEIVK